MASCPPLTLILRCLAIISVSAQEGKKESCERDVVDSLESESLKQCAELVRTAGREQAQKLIEMHKKSVKLTLEYPAVEKVLELPLTFIECTFQKLNLVSGKRGAYSYVKKDQFLANPNLMEIVEMCNKKTPGVCPLKDLSSACLPHPLPLLKCVRQAIFKPCGGSDTAAAAGKETTPTTTTIATIAATAPAIVHNNEGQDAEEGGDGSNPENNSNNNENNNENNNNNNEDNNNNNDNNGAE